MKQALSVLIPLALSISNGFAGTVFQFERTDYRRPTPKAETSEMSVDGRLIKMDQKSLADQPPKNTMIFRGDRGEGGQMIVVDHDKKGYFVLDRQAMSGMTNQMNQAMQQMQAQLKNVPPERRAMIEKMMKSRGGVMGQAQPPRPPAEVTRTDERDMVNGYPCVKYEVTRGGQKVRELWITDWDKVEGGDEAAEAMRAMAKFSEELLSAVSSSVPFKLPESPFAEIDKMNGFPVSTKSFENGRLSEETTLRSSRRQAIDPAAFEPPSRYKRQTMGRPPGR